MDQDARRATLAAELEADPAERGYLALYAKIGAEDGGEWNVFNLLRDPATARLDAIGIAEGEMTIEDVRAAIAVALEHGA